MKNLKRISALFLAVLILAFSLPTATVVAAIIAVAVILITKKESVNN